MNLKIYKDIDGRDPYKDVKRDFYVRKEYIYWLDMHRRHKAYEMLLVHLTLKNPCAIFTGLRETDLYPEDFDDKVVERSVDGFCFAFKPTTLPTPYGDRSFPSNKIFLVFTNDSMCVYNWRIEAVCAKTNILPSDHANRFRERLL